MVHRIFGILLLCFSPVSAIASEVMFEGYYKIELEHQTIGYTILRYSFDAKTKTFESASFLRAKFGEKIVEESLNAKATDKFHPISYQYTAALGDEKKMIDATFNGTIMKLKISDGKKSRDETSKIPKGTFLSTFLPYMLLQQKLELKQAYKYSAVAEEDGNSYWGKAYLQGRETKAGYDLYTVLNKFKAEEFYSQMAIIKDSKDPQKNVKGEVFGTRSPTKSLSSQLVASAAQATQGQLVPNKTLIAVFGGVPTGKVNMVAAPPEVESGSGPSGTIASPVPVSTPKSKGH